MSIGISMNVHEDSDEKFGLQNAKAVVEMTTIAVAAKLLHQPSLDKLVLFVRKHVHRMYLKT